MKLKEDRIDGDAAPLWLIFALLAYFTISFELREDLIRFVLEVIGVIPIR